MKKIIISLVLAGLLVFPSASVYAQTQQEINRTELIMKIIQLIKELIIQIELEELNQPQMPEEIVEIPTGKVEVSEESASNEPDEEVAYEKPYFEVLNCSYMKTSDGVHAEYETSLNVIECRIFTENETRLSDIDIDYSVSVDSVIEWDKTSSRFNKIDGAEGRFKIVAFVPEAQTISFSLNSITLKDIEGNKKTFEFNISETAVRE